MWPQWLGPFWIHLSSTLQNHPLSLFMRIAAEFVAPPWKCLLVITAGHKTSTSWSTHAETSSSRNTRLQLFESYWIHSVQIYRSFSPILLAWICQRMHKEQWPVSVSRSPCDGFRTKGASGRNILWKSFTISCIVSLTGHMCDSTSHHA